MRRRLLWIIPILILILIGLVAALQVRPDEYKFLRDLHPKETRGLLARYPDIDPREDVDHRFEFQMGLSDLKSVLQDRGAKIGWRQGDILDPDRVTLPNGHKGQLEKVTDKVTALRILDEEPSWIDLKLKAVKTILHLR
jgi:hypothetical protein